MLLSAATKRILLFKIRCASVRHSLSQPESFIVGPLLLILCISMYTAVKAGEHQIVAEIIASDGSVQIPRQTQTQRHAATPRSEADMQESGPEKHSIREPPAWRQSLQNTDDLLGQT